MADPKDEGHKVGFAEVAITRSFVLEEEEHSLEEHKDELEEYLETIHSVLPEEEDFIYKYIQEYEEEYEQVYEEEYEHEEPEPFSVFTRLDKPRVLPEPIPLTTDRIKKIENELNLIKLCWPKIDHVFFEGMSDFPRNYYENTDKEKVVLTYAENFRRQFSYKYPDRKPLFLAADNECGMQVSTNM